MKSGDPVTASHPTEMQSIAQEVFFLAPAARFSDLFRHQSQRTRLVSSNPNAQAVTADHPGQQPNAVSSPGIEQ